MYRFTLLESPGSLLTDHRDVQALFGEMIGIRCHTYRRQYDAVPLGPEDLLSHHIIVSDDNKIVASGSFISFSQCKHHSIVLPIQKMCEANADTVGNHLHSELETVDNPWYFGRMVISPRLNRRKRLSKEFNQAIFATFAYVIDRYSITNAYATSVVANGATRLLETVGFEKLYNQTVILPDLNTDAYVVKYGGSLTEYCRGCYESASEMINTMILIRSGNEFS